MDDRRAQFLILLGQVCCAAETAALPIAVVLMDGTRHAGVPAIDAARRGDEIGETGLANPVHVGLAAVDLRWIRRCCVDVPA